MLKPSKQLKLLFCTHSNNLKLSKFIRDRPLREKLFTANFVKNLAQFFKDTSLDWVLFSNSSIRLLSCEFSERTWELHRAAAKRELSCLRFQEIFFSFRRFESFSHEMKMSITSERILAMQSPINSRLMNLTFPWTAPNFTNDFGWYHRITLARVAKWEEKISFATEKNWLTRIGFSRLSFNARWRNLSDRDIVTHGKHFPLTKFTENSALWRTFCFGNTIGSLTVVIDGLTCEQIVSAYNDNIARTSPLPQPVYQLFIASNGRERHKNRLKFYFPHWNLGRRPSGMKIFSFNSPAAEQN